MNSAKSIYIILTDTGTWLSRMIGWYTGKSMNHASIALDSGLHDVYSFGRKMPRNPFIGGFVRENMRGALFLNDKRSTACAIYRCDVSPSQWKKIRLFIHKIEEQEQRYTFNMLGLFSIAAGVEWNRERAYFCSQFVASALEAGGVKLTDKPASLTAPHDYADSSQARLIYEGSLDVYLNSAAAHGTLPATGTARTMFPTAGSVNFNGL